PPWTAGLRQWELHVSHWTTSVAKLDVWQDWVYSGRFHHLFGRYSYMGQPVHGFASTTYGAPTDGYGRLIYLDTHDSAYGSGWKRENSFLPHKPTGVFCYGFFKPNAGAGGYKHPPGGGGVGRSCSSSSARWRQGAPCDAQGRRRRPTAAPGRRSSASTTPSA